MTDKPSTEPDPRTERIRYDGFRGYLQGRDPTRHLAEAFARRVVARAEQVRYGYKEDASAETIAQDLYYWVGST